jgi:hypothetical protein
VFPHQSLLEAEFDMVVPNDAYGGGFGMRTGSNVSALHSMNTKAAEAELISRATQTAIVAARSILLSGGSEEVALKTAKAAAESVLNPQASDSDTISGRSTLGSAFGGRKRKAKRQAEVVASMALMSASSGIRPAGSSMSMSEWDSGPSNHPYGRNIITFRQDEPSVLSGSISTRPPRIPTPKSHTSNPSASGPLAKMTSSSSTGNNAQHFGKALGGSPRTSSKVRDTSGMFFPSQKTSPAPDASAANEKTSDQDVSKSSKDKTKDDNTSSSSFLDKILNIKPTTPRSSEKPSSNSAPKKVPEKLFEMESDSVSQNDTMDSDRQSSVDSSLGDEDSAADTATVESAPTNSKNRRERKEMESSWKYNFDPLLVKVTKTLNIFTCGPLGPFSSGQAGDDLEELETITSTIESPARRGRHDRSSAAVESRDDTFDDNTTNYTCDDTNTEMTGRDARDDDEVNSEFRDPDFGFIESRSSESSNELLRELGMSDTSEGAIQVRSSIRETMEKIVSKSKKGHRRGSSRNDYRSNNSNYDLDKKWLSYELRQKEDEPEIPIVASKKKSKKTSTSSSSRRTPTRKSGGSSNKSVGKKQSFFFKKSKGG